MLATVAGRGLPAPNALSVAPGRSQTMLQRQLPALHAAPGVREVMCGRGPTPAGPWAAADIAA